MGHPHGGCAADGGACHGADLAGQAALALASARTSLTLAAIVIAAWAVLHVAAVWHLDALAHPLLALVALAGLTWLSTGLFIIADDASTASSLRAARA